MAAVVTRCARHDCCLFLYDLYTIVIVTINIDLVYHSRFLCPDSPHPQLFYLLVLPIKADSYINIKYYLQNEWPFFVRV